MPPLPCPLRRAASEHPEAPALIGPDRTLSYHELDQRVSSAAARLVDADPGDFVGLYHSRSWQQVAFILAVLRSGRVACPLNTRTPAAQIERLLERLGSSHLITDQVLESDAYTLLRPDDLLAEGRGSFAAAGFRVDQPATAVFTSGSTATPKAALHSFGNHYYSAYGSNQNIELAPGDRWLLSLPLYHVGGLAILFRCLLAGAAVVIPDPASALGPSLRQHRISHASMVATQLRRLLDATSAPPPSLKAVLLGGGPLPAPLLEKGHRQKWPLFASYGLTEMSSQVATTAPAASLDQLQTAGSVLPFRQLRLNGDSEILVRGRTLFLGYIGKGVVDRPVDAEGWFHTGDTGHFTEEGWLRVHGRKDNLFISGGENIQPEEVERALIDLEGVEEAVVVPVSDDEFGQRPVAFVRAPESALDRLGGRLTETLPRYKIPIAFHPWPAHETKGLKVSRPALRERAEALHDTDG